MNEIPRTPRPDFYGDQEDLEQFLRLVRSPIRTQLREEALQAWSKYKLAKQAQFITGQKQKCGGKAGKWKKGEYQRSLIAPAIDLRGATLVDVCLGFADLRGVRFDDASFAGRPWIAMKGALLQAASLPKAQLQAARLMDTDLRDSNLSGAVLDGADLSGANLTGADLRDAKLRGANLERASLIGAKMQGADLSGSRVYGVSAWDVEVDENKTLQRDLIVTPEEEPEITVDNIEVAQFVYLLLTNAKIRGVIDTVCKKGVLILGCFIKERKEVLNALRDELRRRDFVPLIFDFEKPTEHDITETVKTLAGLCRFIIADVTRPQSVPLELQAIVPDYKVPLVPICAEGERAFSMFRDLYTYRWVIPLLRYSSISRLIKVIEPAIIKPALLKHAELLSAKAQIICDRTDAEYEGE